MTDDHFNSLVRRLRNTLGLPLVEVGHHWLDLREVSAIEQDWSLGRLTVALYLRGDQVFQLSEHEVESNFSDIGCLINRWKTAKLVTYNRLD